MDAALIGFLALLGLIHVILVVVPVVTTVGAPISLKSKLLWCTFLLFLPFVGVAVFHVKCRASLFLGKPWEPSAHDLGVRKPHDSTKDRH